MLVISFGMRLKGIFFDWEMPVKCWSKQFLELRHYDNVIQLEILEMEILSSK